MHRISQYFALLWSALPLLAVSACYDEPLIIADVQAEQTEYLSQSTDTSTDTLTNTSGEKETDGPDNSDTVPPDGETDDTDICGGEAFSTIGPSLKTDIYDSHELEWLLENITQLRQGLLIDNAGNEVKLQALSSIKCIEGDVWVIRTSLEGLGFFENLKKIEGSLYIIANDALKDISAISGVQVRGEWVQIYENDSLSNCDAYDVMHEVEMNDYCIEKNRSDHCEETACPDPFEYSNY